MDVLLGTGNSKSEAQRGKPKGTLESEIRMLNSESEKFQENG